LKFLDLFCGVGGSTLGAKLAGATVTDAYDWDKGALANYHRNHPEVKIHKRNILELTAADLPAGADIIMGSTPCEGFSVANRHGRDLDMTLTNHFLSLVDSYKPRFWVMENVPQVKAFLIHRLPKEQNRCLIASDYGTPQKRRRLMAGNYPEPKKTNSENPFDCLPPPIPFRKIMDKDPENWSILSLKGLKGLFLRATNMCNSGNNFHTRVVGPDDVMPTVLGSDHHGVRAGAVLIYQDGMLRRNTHLEQRRAQGFPDDYIIEGTVEKKSKFVGQAVPPLLMKAIIKACLEAPL